MKIDQKNDLFDGVEVILWFAIENRKQFYRSSIA